MSYERVFAASAGGSHLAANSTGVFRPNHLCGRSV